MSVAKQIEELLAKRIVLLDGAMGTMIQRERLTEDAFRGRRFAGSKRDLKGNNDLLVLTQPDIVSKIHHQYLEAGSDIIETDTFNSNAVSQSAYRLESLAYELNFEGARLARRACDEWTARSPDRPRFVAGSIGPTNRTLSVSPDVNRPAFRAVTFDDLSAAYRDQIRGLIDGGADLLLLETIVDTLNAKAAIVAMEEVFESQIPSPSSRPPVMISVSVTEPSGRTLSGQAIDAFWVSIAHVRPFSVGINCAVGVRDLRPCLVQLAKLADCYISCHPNAGLPNALGEYDEQPSETAAYLREWAENGFVDIVGGCCGTMPSHIAAVAKAVAGAVPRDDRRRRVNQDRQSMGDVAAVRFTRFAGLETLTIRPDSTFQIIGECTNATASTRFATLIEGHRYGDAVQVALDEVRAGASLIDVNMDESTLDPALAMTEFLKYIATEPEIARVPVVVDSVMWSVIVAGLKCVPGKPVVYSISLKEGDEECLRKAVLVRRHGAGVVVTAFDENRQGDTIERKVSICRRAYTLLTGRAGFDPSDIIFDPNIPAIATGRGAQHAHPLNFIEATRTIKATCPGAKVSGRISNLSSSFRGNDIVRAAIHSAFLYHATRAGLDMGIVNARQLVVYEDIPAGLLEHVEDVIFNRRPDATVRLVEVAARVEDDGSKREVDPS